MVAKGRAAKVLILDLADPILALGAALAKLTLTDRFDVDITAAIKSDPQRQQWGRRPPARCMSATTLVAQM